MRLLKLIHCSHDSYTNCPLFTMARESPIAISVPALTILHLILLILYLKRLLLLYFQIINEAKHLYAFTTQLYFLFCGLFPVFSHLFIKSLLLSLLICMSFRYVHDINICLITVVEITSLFFKILFIIFTLKF